MMDEKYNLLATYNAECERGLVHTQEYCDKMRVLQNEFIDGSKLRIETIANRYHLDELYYLDD